MPTSKEEQLATAAADGNSEGVTALLHAKANPNIADEDGDTPLMRAVANSEFDDNSNDDYGGTVTALIKAKADVNSANRNGKTALHLAEDNLGILSLLIEADADLDLANEDGETALYNATDEGSVEVVTALLNAKANPNIANEDGVTPLLLASTEGNGEIFNALLKAKADVSTANEEGMDALVVSILSGHAEYVEPLLAAKADPNKTFFPDGRGGEEIPLLLMAAKSGHTPVVTALLSANADPTKGISDDDDDGEFVTPLMIASMRGHTHIVSALIKAKADVTAWVSKLDGDGKSPLMAACQKGHVQLVEALLKADADISERDGDDDDGATLLLNAISHGNADIVTALLSAGADVHETSDYDGEAITPLMGTCLLIGIQNEEIIAPLLAAGADHSETRINYTFEKTIGKFSEDSTRELTALNAASVKGSVEYVTALIEGGVDVEEPGDEIQSVELATDPKIVKILIEAGALADEDSMSPATLVHAVRHMGKGKGDPDDFDQDHLKWRSPSAMDDSDDEEEEQVQSSSYLPLLANVSEECGWTLLMHAAMVSANIGTVRQMITKKHPDGTHEYIHLNAQDKRNGRTALMFACRNGNGHYVPYLMGAGADLTLKDNDGNTAIDHALAYAAVSGDWQLAIALFLGPTSSKKPVPRDAELMFKMLDQANDANLLEIALGYDAGELQREFANDGYDSDDSMDPVSAKLTDTHRPGEIFLVDTWASIVLGKFAMGDPMWAAIQEASKRYLEKDIEEAAEKTAELAALCRKHAGGKGNQARYNATHDNIKSNPAYKRYVAKLVALADRVNGRQNWIKPTQSVDDFEQVYFNSHQIKPRFDTYVKQICGMAQNHWILPSSLKSPFRSLQKAFKVAQAASSKAASEPSSDSSRCGYRSVRGTCNGEPSGKDGSIRCAKHTCTKAGCSNEKPSKESLCATHSGKLDASACKDVVRGIGQMGDLGKGNILLDLFMGCDVEEAKYNDGGDSITAGVTEKIVFVWIKNRWSTPTNGGWADTLVNFYFANDKTKTICEVQLPHADMMAIREAFGAHNGYDELRKAVELLSITGHADIVAEIEGEGKALELQSAAELEQADSSASNAAIEALRSEFTAFATKVGALETENAALAAKVVELEKAQSASPPTAVASIAIDDAGFGFGAGASSGDGGGDDTTGTANEEFGGFGEQADAPPMISLTAFSDAIASIETLKSRVDALEVKSTAKKEAVPSILTMPSSNASGLELEVQAVVARLERLEATAMTAAFSRPSSSDDGKLKGKGKGKKGPAAKSKQVGLDL